MKKLWTLVRYHGRSIGFAPLPLASRVRAFEVACGGLSQTGLRRPGVSDGRDLSPTVQLSSESMSAVSMQLSRADAWPRIHDLAATASVPERPAQRRRRHRDEASAILCRPTSSFGCTASQANASLMPLAARMLRRPPCRGDDRVAVQTAICYPLQFALLPWSAGEGHDRR
ncbi:hypothetical protein B0J13DRAFT_555564 [Dactylonectria estremocensis]|uniref:Uncharacterized protein n=1 Tax=Dactylonectria estremocensis TaxID=1079267 RepID=A0A9P9EUC7_9HYPO|nr:hypothetical protein B0J13DRAFT_555564 [Dactylonectria estremocensis]